MTTWRMQYRTRKDDSATWGDWGDLPDTLLFSDYYLPRQFEFRALASQSQAAFIFEGTARKDDQ